jgi:transketolase
VRDIFVGTLLELAQADPRVLLITGDLGFGVLDKFKQTLPAQFLNAGVAEQNMTGLATGLALDGRIVFTYSIANFPILRCLEQIRNDAAYHNANVKVVSIGGGFSYGALGMSHHATEDLAIMRALPDVTVVAPGDDWEVAEATKAIYSRAGVCYLRLDKSSASRSQAFESAFELGKIRVIREGAGVAILATGGILAEAIRSADMIAKELGVKPSVASVHTIKPLDKEAIFRLVDSHSVIATLEEHVLAGGLGGAVAEVLVDAGRFPRHFLRFGLQGDSYVSVVGSQSYLRKECGIDANTVVARLRPLL